MTSKELDRIQDEIVKLISLLNYMGEITMPNEGHNIGDAILSMIEITAALAERQKIILHKVINLDERLIKLEKENEADIDGK